MKDIKGFRRLQGWKCLSAIILAAILGGCSFGSYDDAVADFNAGNSGNSGNPPPPPPPPPPGASFGPNFSEIQASVFNANCTNSGCHSGASPAASLNLDENSSYAMLIGVASTQDSAVQRVNVGNPDQSYLITKLEGPGASGEQMPPGAPLAQADIDVMRQWITEGAIDDRAQPATPIRVSALSVAPGATLQTGPAQITAGFDREVDASTVNANTFLLDASNGDGAFDDGDDISITAASISVPGGNPQSAVFDLTGVNLADDTYRIRLLGNGASIIMDLDANALDGEYLGAFPSGNGTAGGDFQARFTVQAPVVLGPTLDQIQAAIFSPSCATSGCHDAGNQAAGLSLANADASFAELVGQFSNQVGQDNVLLVAAGDPDASYLIRKLENAAGITGDRMPPPGRTPVPQADIDVIRQWITDGALR